MKIFHFYDAISGVFHQSSVMTDLDTGADEFAKINCPTGHQVHSGSVDHLCQRKDITTGEVVDYQPPSPSPEYEWNIETKRWQFSASAKDTAELHSSALIRISRLEQSQGRVIREHLLGDPTAKAKLQAIEDEIVSLRKHIRPPVENT